MNTFAKLATHFRRLADHPEKSCHEDVEATAAEAAYLFRRYQAAGKFSWYECSDELWELPLGKTKQSSMAVRWQSICETVYRAFGPFHRPAYYIGAATVESENIDHGTFGAVLSLPPHRYAQRAAEYAFVCDALAKESGETGAAPTTKLEPKAETAAKRRGRLEKAESKSKRTALLATLRQHPTLKDDIPTLAASVQVSESTARRWVEEELQKYRQSKAANVDHDEE